MRLIQPSLAVLGALAIGAVDIERASAAHGYNGNFGYGVHLGGRNFHLDIGRPHGYYGGARRYQSYRYQSHRGARWHDTTHLDWHPGEYVRHYNHYDYVPGHYDVHHSGHWDYPGAHRRW